MDEVSFVVVRPRDGIKSLEDERVDSVQGLEVIHVR